MLALARCVLWLHSLPFLSGQGKSNPFGMVYNSLNSNSERDSTVRRCRGGSRANSRLPPLAMWRWARSAGPSFGWVFWNLAEITEDDVRRMPIQKARTKKAQHHLSTAITILEIEIARSEARAARRDALFQDLPTQALRREYKIIARAEAGFARLIASHIQMLKTFA